MRSELRETRGYERLRRGLPTLRGSMSQDGQLSLEEAAKLS